MADVPQVAKLTFENLQRHLQPTYTFNPMDKESFEVYLKKWLEPHPQDPSLLVYEGRPIDLYKLHCEVIRAGGVRQIVDKDQWPIIAARVAFGDTLGAEAQYARADTAFVQRVYNVYQVFLRSFDERYHISTLHAFHNQNSGCAKYYVGSVPRRPDVTNTATNTSMERPVPPPDERQLVFETLGRLRNETKSLLFPTTSSNLISEAQQAEYRSALNRFSNEMKIVNRRFANYTCVSTVAGLKTLVRVILAAEYQQELLSRDPPQYFLSLEQLKSMAAQVHSADEALKQHFLHVALMHVALR
ncbi:hypothetical protein C2E23DRAFT_889397 [Lenzites betulinus]|nr:hypothetical protein C2E23DRAFT_889397 [Lenzites betulinus]